MKNKLWMIAFIAVILFLSAKPTIADLMSEQDQTVAVSEKLLNSTVKIDTASGASGSGFFIDKHTILTNYHVIKLANGVATITRYNGSTCKGKVGYRDEGNDLALVTVDCEGIPLTFAHNVKIGQTAIVVGNPMDYDFSVSKGIVSSKTNGYIQIDAHLNFGSSGGVVANLQGEVIAIVRSKSLESDYVGFGITVNRIEMFLHSAGRD